MSAFLTKYLDYYAEVEAAELTGIPFASYGACLVIPAYDESEGSIDRVVSKLDLSKKILLILVANAPSGSADTTRQLVNQLRLHHPITWRGSQFNCLLSFTPAIDLLLIDRCSEGREIPLRKGVGLARKIGADIATHLICGRMIADPWIYTTDADACLPAGYFDAISKNAVAMDALQQRGAVLFPFRHSAAPDLTQAALLYELSLHYYVRALQWAGSPYGYHSIGSTLAVHYESYAMVRGFPKRAAGEDFYLLNKIAKVASISRLTSPEVEINARQSSRTPFGTGSNVTRIKSLQTPLDQYLYYHPEIFSLLKGWLDGIRTLWVDREPMRVYGSADLSDDQIRSLNRCLTALKVPQAVAKGFQHYRNAEHFDHFLQEWFDAFKTLKFVHFLRDQIYPSVPLREMLTAPFMRTFAAEFVEDWSRPGGPQDGVSRSQLNNQLEQIIDKIRSHQA